MANTLFELDWALLKDDDAFARSLVDACPPERIDSLWPGTKRTALGHASHRGNLALMTYLIYTKKATVSSRDRHGADPIHIACYQGHHAAVELLLQAGASAEHPNRRGYTPLQIAACSGSVTTVQLIVRHLTELSSDDESLYKALSVAAEQGFDDIVELLLPRTYLDVIEKGCDSTPLMYAAAHGHSSIVNKLLDARDPIDTRGNNAIIQPALKLAIRYGHDIVVGTLLSRGGNPNWANNSGETHLMTAALLSWPIVVRKLLNAKVDIDAKDNKGFTALHHAVSEGSHLVTEILLEKADPKIRTSNGDTALSLAAKAGDEVSVVLLIQHPKVDLDETNNGGLSPLMLAAGLGYESIVHHLVAAGAKLSPDSSETMSALDRARSERHSSVASFLEQSIAAQETETSIASTMDPAENNTDSLYPLESRHWPMHTTHFLGQFYNGYGFKNFPNFCGYPLSTIDSTIDPSSASRLWGQPLDRWLRFLQSWLYFGLITEVFRAALASFPVRILATGSAEDVRRHNEAAQMYRRPSCSIIDLRCLVVDNKIAPRLPLKYYNEWRFKAALSSLPKAECVKRAKVVKDILSTAAGVCMRLDVLSRKPGSPLKSEEWLSNILLFSITGQYLTNLARACYTSDRKEAESFMWPEWRPTFTVELMLLAKNWCMPATKALSSTTCVDSLFLYAQHDSAKDHRQCPSGSAGECIANRVDETNYEVAHSIYDGGECRYSNFFSSVQSELAEILENGDIPVILLGVDEARILQHDNNLPMDAIIIPAQRARMPYFAISHVWSDGLGNPNANRIRICQFRRILNSCQNADSTIRAFWLDTLCVPHEGRLRKLAIRNMGMVYKNASHVLVLDRALSVTPPLSPAIYSTEQAKDEAVLTVLTKFSLSDWTRRLWTLQEGVFAQSISFEINGSTVPLEKALTHARLQKTHLESSVYEDCKQMIGFFRPEMNLRFPYTPSMARYFEEEGRAPAEMLRHLRQKCATDGYLIALTKSIEWRSTSRAEDEALCLATLLEFDVTPFLQGSAESRMSRLWERIESFEEDILYANVPRLQTPGQRWCPTSLLHTGVQFNLSLDRRLCPVDRMGIWVSARTFMLELVDQSGAPFWGMPCVDHTGGMYEDSTARTMILSILQSDLNIGSISWSSHHLNTESRYGIIIQNERAGIPPERTHPDLASLQYGLLAAILSDSTSTIYAYPVVAVAIANTKLRDSREGDDGLHTEARYVGVREWCIG